MAHEYNVGDAAVLFAEFRLTLTGQLTDPTTTTLRVRDPSGNEDAYTYAGGTVTRDGVGRFQKTITLDEAGIWDYWWEGTGAVQKNEDGTLIVKPSRMGLDS